MMRSKIFRIFLLGLLLLAPCYSLASGISGGGGGSGGTATDLSLTGQTQGAIAYYDGSHWVVLSPSTSGYLLQTGGTGANPSWTGTVNFSSIVIPANVQFTSDTTGSGTPSFGANCPATTTSAPYTWLTVKSSDGSTVYIPVWK